MVIGVLPGHKGRIGHHDHTHLIGQIPSALPMRSANWLIEKGHTVSARNTSRFGRRIAAELKAAGWQLERFLSDNGNEFKGEFSTLTTTLGAAPTRIHAGRPQTNG